MRLPLLLVLFSPFRKPRYAFAVSPSDARKGYFFPCPESATILHRDGVKYRRWRDDEGGKPNPPPPPDEEKPLTPLEKFLWIGFAVWVGVTFLAIFAVMALGHVG